MANFKEGDRVIVRKAPGAYPESLFGLTGTVEGVAFGDGPVTTVYYVRLDSGVPESAEGDTWYFDEGFLVQGAPARDDDRTLRVVRLDGFILHLWDTYQRGEYNKHQLGYAFYQEGEPEPIFLGEDFYPSPMDAIDSDATIRSLLGFLTLQQGDTDDDYFKDYTERQWDFANNYAEEVGIWSLAPEEGDHFTLTFEDLL